MHLWLTNFQQAWSYNTQCKKESVFNEQAIKLDIHRWKNKFGL